MSTIQKIPRVKLLLTKNTVRLMSAPTDWRPYTVLAEIPLTADQHKLFSEAIFSYEKEPSRAERSIQKTRS